VTQGVNPFLLNLERKLTEELTRDNKQNKRIKAGKRKKLLEKKLRRESKEREERGLEICKICKFSLIIKSPLIFRKVGYKY
jgi:hypothetical protein